jgi:hypothetical protein
MTVRHREPARARGAPAPKAPKAPLMALTAQERTAPASLVDHRKRAMPNTAPDARRRRRKASSTLTPSERVMRARLASHESWARTSDRTARTAPGTKALMTSFERQVDPNGELPPAELARRAEAAKKAHFTRMALKSATARRARSGSKSARCR